MVLQEEVRTAHVCRKCQSQLLRVEELQKQLEGLRTKLKRMVQASHPVQPHTRGRSPSIQRTGASPAEKRARPSRGSAGRHC